MIAMITVRPEPVFCVLLLSEPLGHLSGPSWYKVFQRSWGLVLCSLFFQKEWRFTAGKPSLLQGFTGLLWGTQGGGSVPPPLPLCPGEHAGPSVGDELPSAV